jgi:glycosyltransferase involved in cell wall biosynthesis
MATPTISVALCTHNGAAYVREQVESILRQTVPVTEIVLSDDASTDDTVAIVESTVAGWPVPRPVLRVIRNSRALGVVANFEQATASCTGEFISLSDQDDVWLEGKLEGLIGILVAEPDALLVHSDAQLVDEKLHVLPDSLLESLETRSAEKRELLDGRSFQTLLRRNLVTGATVVFRRVLLEQARPFPKSWVHDEWLAIIAAAITHTRLDTARLVLYRQHGANQIGAVTPTLDYKIGKLFEPRAGRNERLVERSRVLVERLTLAGDVIAPERLDAARRKLAHERFRQGLPRWRVLRAPAVLAALLAGRYSRYSRGIPDAVRDLLQSAR